ncbi:MAG: hypothetical protein LBG15_02675 [Dysgonamonadaceae bacterium]|jgi:hypothetical protein|nr:hypothetical protein [Dysgonamonadaceae bacterium]
MDKQHKKNTELDAIRELMERSSTCIGLSGLGGILAGVLALVGASCAYYWIEDFKENVYAVKVLQQKLLLLAAAVFAGALFCVLFFSYRRSEKIQIPFWNSATRRLFISIAVPFIAGSFIFLWALNNQFYFLLPAVSLIIYGMAIFCGSYYTTSESRYLAFAEMILGCVTIWQPAYGLLFLTTGFGVLHIIYGVVIWFRYERKDVR